MVPTELQYLKGAARGTALWRRFPVTILMLGQFLAFYAIPALFSSVPPIPGVWQLVIRIFSIVIAAALLSEALTYWVQASRRGGVSPAVSPENPSAHASVERYSKLAIVAIVLGLIAGVGLVLGTFSDVNTYGLDLEANAASRASQVARFLETATLPAVATAFILLRAGKIRRAAYFSLGIIVMCNVFASMNGGFLINLALLGFLLTAMGFLTQTLNWRAFVLIALSTLLVFPILYDYRNAFRAEMNASASFIEPLERVRQDKWLGDMLLASPSTSITLPDDAAMLRYAIPKPLDPSRPPLDTGQQLNVAIGGAYESATTFTQPGNIYYLRGGAYLAIFYLATAAALHWLYRRSGSVYAMTLLVSLVNSLIWIGGQYPGSMAGFVQDSAYGLLLLALVSAGVKLVSGSRMQSIPHLRSGPLALTASTDTDLA